MRVGITSRSGVPVIRFVPRMWASRTQHVSVQDVFGVPPDVRDTLGPVLPGTQFDLFALSSAHGVALTPQTELPYEVYVSWSTARNRVGAVRALVASRDSHAACAAMIPPHADPTMPVCRDVWAFVRGAPRRQVAMDILYPPGPAPPGAPMCAHVLLFDAEDIETTPDPRPRGVKLHVPVEVRRVETA